MFWAISLAVVLLGGFFHLGASMAMIIKEGTHASPASEHEH